MGRDEGSKVSSGRLAGMFHVKHVVCSLWTKENHLEKKSCM